LDYVIGGFFRTDLTDTGKIWVSSADWLHSLSASSTSKSVCSRSDWMIGPWMWAVKF